MFNRNVQIADGKPLFYFGEKLPNTFFGENESISHQPKADVHCTLTEHCTVQSLKLDTLKLKVSKRCSAISIKRTTPNISEKRLILNDSKWFKMIV